MTEEKSIYKHMIRGSAWALAMRWGVRGIGFVSMVILARLLTPADFGIVAMGAMVIAFLRASTDMGVAQLVIREHSITREFTDTAWTFQLLQALFTALLLVLLAPLAARYFSEPRVILVIYVLAVGAIIGGTHNIGMVLVRRELDFARDFRFYMYQRLSRFVVVVTLAVIMRSYWALVIGQLISRIVGIALSYRMHSYRPRLSLARAREFLVFSFSIVPFRIAKFLNNRAHTIVVAGLGSTAQLGAYHVASELSTLFTREAVLPLGRGLFPSYAKLAQEPEKLRTVYLYVLGVSAMLCFPLGLGLSRVAGGFVLVVFGEQWVAAVPLLRWLAIYATVSALLHIASEQILIVTGKEKIAAILSWARLAIFVPAVAVGANAGGAHGVAVAATVATIVMIPAAAYSLRLALPVSYGQLAGALWRPLSASLIMVGAMGVIDFEMITGRALALIGEIITGAAIYALAMGMLWTVAGRPDGPEKFLFSFAASKFGRKRKP